MGDMAEVFNAMREDSRQRRKRNYDHAISRLDDIGINYRTLSNSHLRIGNIDYWPSTGLFIHMKINKKGRGIKNLIKMINSLPREEL
jgi:hypothetical protein